MQNTLPAFVIVKTKSNYRNLNGKPLELVELVGFRVSVCVDGIVIDFNIKEVVEFKHKL